MKGVFTLFFPFGYITQIRYVIAHISRLEIFILTYAVIPCKGQQEALLVRVDSSFLAFLRESTAGFLSNKL